MAPKTWSNHTHRKILQPDWGFIAVSSEIISTHQPEVWKNWKLQVVWPAWCLSSPSSHPCLDSHGQENTQFALHFLNRCNAKGSCSFDGRAGCVAGGCDVGAGFNHYFGNPCEPAKSARKKREVPCTPPQGLLDSGYWESYGKYYKVRDNCDLEKVQLLISMCCKKGFRLAGILPRCRWHMC